MNDPRFGIQFQAQDLTKPYHLGPGQYLVQKFIEQMNQVKAFRDLFGEYDSEGKSGRWADYARSDWSIRQLPAINVFEADTETKESSRGYLSGTLQLMVLWQLSLRRSDLRKIPLAFKGLIQAFIESRFVRLMLDENSCVMRREKVPGLVDLGKAMTWNPNVAGVVENEQVPVTIINLSYRIDLEKWYSYLEREGMTPDQPFDEKSFVEISGLNVTIDGVDDEGNTQVEVPLTINLENDPGGEETNGTDNDCKSLNT